MTTHTQKMEELMKGLEEALDNRYGDGMGQIEDGAKTTQVAYLALKVFSQAITSAITEERERCLAEVEELEVSCIDDRLLGRTDEYLDGWNESTETWRRKRDEVVEAISNLK